MAEMFLKLDGIEGESLDSAAPVAHANEIEIKSWGWGAENKVKWEVNQGGHSVKVDVKDIVLEKQCDKASVALYQCCVTGKHIKHGTIVCRKNDGEQKVEYLTVKLTDIMVANMVWNGEGGETTLKESVTLSFAQFHLDYKLQNDTGNAAGSSSFGFNIQKQQKV
jgi:type VI secretion system secreted protein Hcp